eukprot:gene11553-11696_t
MESTSGLMVDQKKSSRQVFAGEVLSFDAGMDDQGFTMAYVDADRDFCAQMLSKVDLQSKLEATLSMCGRMWLSTDKGTTFTRTEHHTYKVADLSLQTAGKLLNSPAAEASAPVHMADNNGRLVYSVPHRSWGRNYGVRVFRTDISPDGLVPSTYKVLDQMDVDSNYGLWPADKLEYSAVGLDVGYWDGGYYSFHVNQLNANEAGGSENFFLHVTRNGGQHWHAPFTQYRDCGPRASSKRWSTTGAADIHGIGSQDGGETWQIIDPKHQAVVNSIYSYAFDPTSSSRTFVATAKWHDYPTAWYANPLNGNGGIFASDDNGRTFKRVGLTSSKACTSCNDMVNDFLAVAYDKSGGFLYAGGHINGIARIHLATDTQWEWINFNLLGDDLWQNETIINRIAVDPENGDVYALLTGNRALGTPRNMLNQPRTGVYVMPRGGTKWQLLRGKIAGLPLPDVKPWFYPTSFAVDWSRGTPGNRSHILLVDMSNNLQPSRSTGIWQTSDGGNTWLYRQQSDWATNVIYDPFHQNRVYATGPRAISPWDRAQPGGWGFGGFMFSDDGGSTWATDDANPFQNIINSVAVDASRPCQLWFATAGAGLILGPAPPGLPGC